MDLEVSSLVSISDGVLEFDDFQLEIESWSNGPGLQLISGPNGSGKSTFLRVILGLAPLKSGVRKSTVLTSALGYVPQNYRQALFPWTNCYGNLERFRGLDVDYAISRLIELGIPKSDLKKRPPALSGGQAQRLAIVREITLGPKLLILDEPFSSLDISSASMVATIVAEKIEDGMHVIMTSHQDLPHILEKLVSTTVSIERYQESKARVTICEY